MYVKSKRISMWKLHVSHKWKVIFTNWWKKATHEFPSSSWMVWWFFCRLKLWLDSILLENLCGTFFFFVQRLINFPTISHDTHLLNYSNERKCKLWSRFTITYWLRFWHSIEKISLNSRWLWGDFKRNVINFAYSTCAVPLKQQQLQQQQLGANCTCSRLGLIFFCFSIYMEN